MLRFTEDEFDSEQSITIGVDFKTKVINIDGVNVKLGMLLRFHSEYPIGHLLD